MATVFSKQVQGQEGTWAVIIGIVSKDPNDVTFAQQYGDIDLDFAGQYVDPLDDTFTFTIPPNSPLNNTKYSDILLNKLPNVTFTYLFNDAAVMATTRYRQAVIFANAVETRIHDAIDALRAMSVTVPINTTFSV